MKGQAAGGGGVGGGHVLRRDSKCISRRMMGLEVPDGKRRFMEGKREDIKCYLV